MFKKKILLLTAYESEKQIKKNKIQVFLKNICKCKKILLSSLLVNPLT